jgi:hypothetical protein
MQARMRQVYLFAVVAVASVVVLGGTALAQSSNSEVGTWKLNLAKSKYRQGPAAPKSTTIKTEAAGAGIKTVVDTVAADGAAIHYEFTLNYDGKDNPVIGNSPNGDTMARTRINATTAKTVNKKGGKITTTQTAVVSSDGKTRTVTTTGTNPLGQTVNSVAVYDKQ